MTNSDHPNHLASPMPASVKKRAPDRGPDHLPDMEQFVALVRKIRRPALLFQLLNAMTPHGVAEPKPRPATRPAVMPPAELEALFRSVAVYEATTRQSLERAADLILALSDEFGSLAVQSLLEGPEEAELLAAGIDPASRALYLYLRQFFPAEGAKADARFLRADQVQAMNRTWKSEHYSSHFEGPKGVDPCVTDTALETLRDRIVAFYPQLTADDITIEHYTRHDFGHADRGDPESGEGPKALLHTVTAFFNGGQAVFKQVQQGDVIDRVEPAAISICYSWEPATGLLGVFSEDREFRQAFATAFRDELLARAGAIEDMPMREFQLGGFLDAQMIDRLQDGRISGVEQIAIQSLKVAMLEEQPDVDRRNGRPIIRQIASPLTIGRDRHDPREVYQLARDVHGIRNLSAYCLQKLRLTMFMAAQPHRPAHRVSVELTAPNGLSDRSKTAEDRRRILAQLSHLGVMREW